MDFSSIDYFGLSAPKMRIGSATVWLWHLFNRTMADGRGEAGIGVLNINGRHLLYVGLSTCVGELPAWRVCVGFVWIVNGTGKARR